MLNNVWRSSQYSTHSKLKINHSCVLSTLLYGSECWRMVESDLGRLSTFHTKRLRKKLASHHQQESAYAVQGGHGYHYHAKSLGVDWPRHKKGKWIHHQDSTTLDTWRQTQAWQAQEYVATYCWDRNEGLKLNHSWNTVKSWPKTDSGGRLLLLPFMPVGPQ